MNFEIWRENYFKERKRILSDKNLNEFQKENEIRKISGLDALTIKEFNQRILNEIYSH